MENVTNVKCPFCNEPIKEGDMTVTCPDCGAIHHAQCWNARGGCAVNGCKKAPSSTSICAKCGASLHPNALFCAGCGTPVAQPAAPKAALCANCGTPLPEHAIFCGVCGTPVKAPESSPAVPNANTCATCGAILPENAIFCGVCGTPKNTPTPSQQPVAPSANICANCGASLSANALFCAECGTPVASGKTAPAAAPQENPNAPVYAEACGLLERAENKESLEKAALLFEGLGDYLNSTELQQQCKDMLNYLNYDEAAVLERNAESIADYQRAIHIYHKLGEYRDSKQRAEFCEQSIQERQKQMAYEAAMQRLSAAQTVKELEAAYRMLEKLVDYKDVNEQLVLCTRKLEALTQSGQETLPQETSVPSQEAQPALSEKKQKKTGIIILSIVTLLLAAAVVLSIFVFIPQYYTSKADDLLRQKKNQEALEIYQDYSSYDSNEQKIKAINAITQMEKGYLIQGLKAMLDAGVPVTVTYKNGTDSTESQSYQKSNELIALKTPTAADWKIEAYTYSFDGKNLFEITLVPDLGSGSFGIAYDLAGGVLNVENPVQYSSTDADIVLNNPTRDGYTFIGWTGTDLTEPTLNVTIPSGSVGSRWYVANWEAAGFKIEYDLAGGVLNRTNPTWYNTTDRSFVLNNPTREGYEFIGWTGTDLTELTLDVTVPSGSQGDRVYIANWMIAQYTVTFKDVAQSVSVTLNYNYYGSQSETIHLAHGSTFRYPTVPTRNGYLFAGWYTNSACTNRYSFSGTLSSNLTLYAKWQDISRYSSINVGTSSSIYVYGTSMNYYAFVPLVSGSITVYTTGSVDTYGYLYKSNMTYCTSNDDDGNSLNFQYTYTVEKGEIYYIGVRGSNNNPYNNSGYATLYISGVAVPTSTAVVNSSAPANINSGTPLTYDYGNQVTTTVTIADKIYLPTPTREGYTFAGWYIGRDRVTGSYISVSENTILTAKWN